MEGGIDLEEHPILSFLVAEDMKGLFNFARDHGYRDSERGYVSKCDLCLALRRYPVSRGDIGSLAPREFYQHVE